MTKAEVMDLTIVCRSFPELPEPLIERGNFLATIDRVFESSTEVVVAEGEEGIGKTTLLAQFAKRHPDHTLSLFIRPTSRWGHDPEILRFDLCNQIQWAACQEELSSIEDASDAFLRSGVTKLQRRTRYGERFFFAIDGLDEIPEESAYVRELVLGMVPLGLPGFRFLLSGDLDELSEHLPRGVRRKSYPLSGFTLGQVLRYFEDLEIDRESLKEISETCRAIPGHLETVRRILKTGTDVRDLLSEWPDKQLFEIEWNRVDSDNEEQVTLLAILAHDRRRHTLNDLARITDLQPAAVERRFENLGFISKTSEGEVAFVSEAFRSFAAKQLWHLRDQANDLLINHLLRDPDSDTALRYLPGHFESAGRFEDILNYLSSDHFPRILEFSQSLGPVKKQAQLGLDTARELRRDGYLVRFGIEKSVMTEVGGTSVWQSEIEARMALGDYDSAVALAQSSILKEERLYLLATIARAKCEQGLSPSLELQDQIRQLYSQIDYTALDNERLVEIAEELIYSEPELAIEMVEEATNARVDENALDWAFAKLAIRASSSNYGKYQSVDTAHNIRSRIQDPELRSFSGAVSLLVGDYQAAEVVEWVSKNLDSVDKRLYVLRQWAMDHRERADAAEVVRSALDLTIQSTPYAPNAGVFRQIATPLPFISDSAVARDLVDRFDAQKGTVERYGPTEDYVRLQLTLARAESKYDFDAACNRFLDVYQYASELDDLAVKTGCMARMVTTLAEMDPDSRLETEAGLHSRVQRELVSDTETLLDATAEHYYAARNVVRALAKQKPETALDLAKRLNTEARRDLAFLELVRSASQACPDELDLTIIRNVIDCISDPELRDEAVIEVLKRLASISERNEPLAKAALPFSVYVEQIRGAGERCRACCLAHSFFLAQDPDEYSGLLSHFQHLLESAWEAIGVGWHRVDVGFRVVRALAEDSLETARAYLEATEQWREKIFLDTKSAALTYCGCIRLAIRAYGGLLPTKLDSPEDTERVGQLIARLPSNGERAELWAELALQCYINRRLDECKQIVVEHVKPALQGVPEEDSRYRAKTTVTVAPALYCAHRQTALDCISDLPRRYRDEAYAKICELLLSRQPPSEPYAAVAGHVYNVSYEEIVDICELLKLMDHDNSIYYFIESIVNSVVTGRRRRDFTRQQRADIVTRLDALVARFPRERHIEHDGYKIAAQAQVARMKRVRSEEWIELVESARSRVPNLADRALVLCVIAAAMPTRDRDRQSAVLKEAESLVEAIPSTLDRIERYEDFASLILNIDVNRAKDFLNSAMSFARADKPELYSHQRRIINLAYIIDEGFAESLASLADDDPARVETRANIKQQLQVLDLKSKMANQLESGETVDRSSQLDLSRAAWKLLGELNAGRTASIPLDRSRNLMQPAADLPFKRSYPIMAWMIENAKRHLASAPTRERFRPIFEAILLGSELAATLAARSSAKLERIKCRTIEYSEEGSMLIRAGEREKALRALRDWFDHEVEGYLKICDPFFGPEDLEVLLLLRSVNPTCHVQILTSQKQHDQEVKKPWEETYRNYWRLQISSSQDPPPTDVVIVGVRSSGKSPIHDRWWVTDGKGIRIGTSFNSLGIGSSSEISQLSEQEARAREAEADQYLGRNTRQYNGERLDYTLFTL
jgi:hypothetical protein